MNFFSKLSMAVFLAALLSGCATPVNSQIPTTVFEGSETHGHFEDRTNLFADAGYRSDVLAEIIPDVTTDPIITNRVKMNSGGDLFGRLKASFHDRFEAGAALVTSGLPVRAHAKWMFFGEPSSRAKKGDLSAALVGELSLNTGHHWTDQETEIFTGKVYKSEVTETKASSIAGLLSGYRVSDRVLFYTGLYICGARDQGVIEPSIGGTRQKDVKFDFKASGYSLPLGCELFSDRVSLRLEAVYSSLKASQSARYHAWGLNLALSF